MGTFFSKEPSVNRNPSNIPWPPLPQSLVENQWCTSRYEDVLTNSLALSSVKQKVGKDLHKLKRFIYNRRLSPEEIDDLIRDHLGHMDGIIITLANEASSDILGFSRHTYNKNLEAAMVTMQSELESVGSVAYRVLLRQAAGQDRYFPTDPARKALVALLHSSGETCRAGCLESPVPERVVRQRANRIVALLMPEQRAKVWRDSKFAFNEFSPISVSAITH